MKTEFKWSPALDVCHDRMNDEHKVLIAQMGRLQNLALTSAQHSKLLAEIEHLLNLTKTHFDHEERLLEEVKYPDIATHRTIHSQLIKRLTDFRDQFQVGTAKVDERFFGFLRVRLTGHIMDIDHQYGEHIQRKLPGKKLIA